MKRFKSLVLALIFGLTIALPVYHSVNAQTNLIANPSVENAATTTRPNNWTTNRWGTNTATFTYASNGRTGNRSLLVSMTKYTSGDAKWMHKAAAVTGNTAYTYTGYYKSTVGTELVLQYTDANGKVTYASATNAPASSSWKAVTHKFTTPASARTVVVLHIIKKIGTLRTDDFSLALTNVAEPPASTPNLIKNSSFETASETGPTDWYKNNWGTNSSQFEYNTTGRTGTRSVTAKITNYANGDAKWYAEPVSVTPGSTYTYSDYYTSSIPSRVVVAYISSSNEYTYQEQATAPASTTTWAKYTSSFLVPAGAAKVSVYHLVDAVGSLTIDDVSLTTQTTQPPQTSIIPNYSLETAAGTLPASWQHNSWGNNASSFAYMNEGHTGTKSIKVTVSNYVDGDAKWYFNPITSLVPGRQYTFSAWYKTNTKAPRVVAMLTDNAGTVRYMGLRNAIPSGSTTAWQQYQDTFTVPTGTASVSMFMLIAENGWLQTDDYGITDYQPVGFSRPLLSLTYDDGLEDNITTLLPLLAQYNIKSTQCLATDFIEGNQEAIDRVLAFHRAGHEICSHTVTHPFLSQVPNSTQVYELSHAKQYLESIIGASVPNFATPFGDYNGSVLTNIKSYYQSHRTVDTGYNSKDNTDIYRLRVQNILSTTTASEVDAWIKKAQADKTWLIFVYHRVANDPGLYDTTPALMQQQLEVIKNSGIVVKTYQDALTEVRSQL